MSRHARNALVAFGQHALGAVGGAVGFFFVARQLPNAQVHWGTVGFAIQFVGLFLAVQRAFDGAHVKRVSEGREIARCNSTYALLNLGSTLSLVALVLGGVFLWQEVFGKGFQTPLHVRAIELFVVYHVLNSLGEMARKTYEGQQSILPGQLMLGAEHLVKTAAIIYVAFNGLEPFASGFRDSVGLSLAYVIGAAALAVTGLIFLWGQPFGRPSWDLAKSYARFAIPDTITGTIHRLATNSYEIMLQLFWGAANVGFFFAANRYIQFLPAFAGALTTTFFPFFSQQHSGGRARPDVVQRLLRVVSLCLLPVVAVSFALPEAVFHVLASDDFLPAAPVLMILSLGAYLNAIRKTIGSKLRGVNQPGEVTIASLYSMLSTLGFGVVLVAPSLWGIPLFGLKAPGAALAFLISQIIGIGHLAQAAKKHAQVRFPDLKRQVGMFLGTVGILHGLTYLIPQTSFRIWHLAGASGLSMLSFGALGFLLGELGKDDVRVAWNVLRPKEWRNFFKEESRRGPRSDRVGPGEEPGDDERESLEDDAP